MYNNNQLCYQDTETNKIIQLHEKNQPNNFLETPPAEDFDNTMTSFNEVVEKMKRAFESDKKYVLPAMKSFVNSFQTNVRTHASLNCAMQLFGKYSGFNPHSKNPKLMGTRKIGVQPTTRARSKTEIGGRPNLTAGRTPKWRRVPEHGYTNKISSSRLHQMKHKTPHSLTRCVEINKALGSTHSSK